MVRANGSQCVEELELLMLIINFWPNVILFQWHRYRRVRDRVTVNFSSQNINPEATNSYCFGKSHKI